MKKTIEKPGKGKKESKKASSSPERMASVSVKAKMSPAKVSFKPKTTAERM